eukprot:g573.t1
MSTKGTVGTAAGSGFSAARRQSMGAENRPAASLNFGNLNIGVECQRCGAATRWNAMFCPTCGFDSPYNATMKSYSESSVPRQKGKAGRQGPEHSKRSSVAGQNPLAVKRKRRKGKGKKRSKKGKGRGKVEAQDHEQQQQEEDHNSGPNADIIQTLQNVARIEKANGNLNEAEAYRSTADALQTVGTKITSTADVKKLHGVMPKGLDMVGQILLSNARRSFGGGIDIMEQADIMIQARRAEAMKANSVNSKVIRGAREALAALLEEEQEREREREAFWWEATTQARSQEEKDDLLRIFDNERQQAVHRIMGVLPAAIGTEGASKLVVGVTPGGLLNPLPHMHPEDSSIFSATATSQRESDYSNQKNADDKDGAGGDIEPVLPEKEVVVELQKARKILGDATTTVVDSGGSALDLVEPNQDLQGTLMMQSLANFQSPRVEAVESVRDDELSSVAAAENPHQNAIDTRRLQMQERYSRSTILQKKRHADRIRKRPRVIMHDGVHVHVLDDEGIVIPEVPSENEQEDSVTPVAAQNGSGIFWGQGNNASVQDGESYAEENMANA